MRFFLSTDNYQLTAPARTARGMTLIEVLFTIGVVGIVFVGIYGVFKVSIAVVTDSKARAGALALAQERMEQIRSLPYTAVGTSGGIPAGTLAQSESVVLNQTTYTRRTFISYVDDPADGTGALDSNGITADYKLVKVEMLWTSREALRTYSQVSTIVPKGIESLTGGGTLRVQVYDALSQPLSGATVHILNTTGSTTIDITTYTNAEGFVAFPGTPVGTGYAITVSKAGYSSAQTYASSVQNPNPTPGHLSVADAQTTSVSFFIDRLASLAVRTLKPIEEKTWEDEFDVDTSLVSLASTTVVGGGLVLSGGPDNFAAAGTAIATSVRPSYLAAWKRAAWTVVTPAGTSAKVRIYYDAAGTPALVPDAALAGNSAGFVTSPVDISALSTTTYPALGLGATLTTSNPSATADVRRWQIDYDHGPVPVPNVPFALSGQKTIGTTGAGAAIYKFSQTLSTDATGAFSTSTLEWDTYPLSIDGVATGFDISEACAPVPISIAPNAAIAVDLYLVPDTAHSLLVAARDASTGALIGGATARLTRAGVDLTRTTSACGQGFFSGLAEGSVALGTEYSLSVSRTGYQSATVSDVEVSGVANLSVTLTPQ